MFNNWFGKDETTDLRLSGSEKSVNANSRSLERNEQIKRLLEPKQAATDWPDDMKLNKLLANLSGRSADFVSALNKAQEAEAKKELGYSLTWYVNAQSFYPASTIANEGIDRISKQILSPSAADSASAPVN